VQGIDKNSSVPVGAGGWKRVGLFISALILALLCMAPPTLNAFTVENVSDGMALGRHLSVLKDETQRMGIDQVRRSAASGSFRAVNGGDEPNFSYTNSAVWLHTTLENGTSETDWLVELGFSLLDEVELYLIDKTTGVTINYYRTGDTLPFAERPLAHRHFVFPLTLAPNGSYELYMRIRTEGTMTTPLFFWKSASFEHAGRNAYMAMMLYFGFLLAFFVYILRLYFSLRDRVYLYYLCYMASFVLAMGSWNGLFYEYLWPESPRWAGISSVIGYNLTGLFGAFFSRTFLNSRIYTPKLDRIMMVCGWVFALLVVAAPLWDYQLISKLTSASGVIFALVAVASAALCFRQGQQSARYFLLGWSLLLLGTAILGARSFGIMPTNSLTLYAMQFGSAIEIVLFLFALAERIIELRRDKDKAEEAAMAAKREMVEVLERTELELERRVKERTCEITALNNQLREQEQRLKGLAMYDALTGLANRTLLDERISEALASAERQSNKVALLLIDLDEFKPINDTYGHDVGDAVLQDIAARLQRLVRSSDTVARLGGDEFVIVLPGLGDVARAVAIGESVIQELSQPVTIGAHTLTVGASIGISFYPHDGIESGSLLKQADKAMYEAKRAGRNRLFISTDLAA
jgi:diguanylate cyclase (GGDEF)-like protein